MNTHCLTCTAQILWARTDATGKPIQIDVKPPEPGKANVRLVFVRGGPPTAYIVEPGKGTHVSHFVTCPHADQHRKPQAQGKLL